jgi:hypothetical protein
MTRTLPTGNPGGPSVGRLIISICAALLAALTAFALVRAGVFYSLYTWLFHQVIETTGLDLWFSRAITLLALAVLWSLPWHLAILPWVGKAGRRAAFWFIMIALALASMELITRDVYFSRADGRPLKFYIQTLDGYKFSATPDTDPVYGLTYQPITADVARKYMLWKERGGQMQDPSVQDGLNFNPVTGEPIRWYARAPSGKLEFFTLPGFHPKYGTKLAPATPEVITEYEKQEAERKAVEEAARKAKDYAEAQRKAQTALENQARVVALPRPPLVSGRYIFSNLSVDTSDGLRFTLPEIDVTAYEMILQLGIETTGVELASSSYLTVLRIALLTAAGGVPVDVVAIRSKEGRPTSTDGSIVFPKAHLRGAYVVEFTRRGDFVEGFALIVNDQPIVTGIDLRKAKFLSY